MSQLIRTDIRLIDRQERKDCSAHHVVELYTDPEGRKLKFDAYINLQYDYHSKATCSVWDGSKWQQLHNLLVPGEDPAVAISVLFSVVADLLDWPEAEAEAA